MKPPNEVEKQTPELELDDKDFEIVDAIIGRPRATVAALAKTLKYKPDTLQKRLNFLFDSGCLSREMRVLNWEAVGYPLLYRIDIIVDQRALAIEQGGPRTNSNSKTAGTAGAEPFTIKDQKQLATYIKDVLGKDSRYRNKLVVQSVHILLGHQADLSVTVRAKNQDAALDFVINGLRVLGGVQTTMTAHAAWSY